MFYLKHKHMIQQDQKNLQGQLLNVTKSVQTLEQALMSTETMDCLRNTADTLNSATQGNVLDGADEAADDFDEACDTTAELAEALSVPIGAQPCESKLEDEFDTLCDGRAAEPQPVAVAPQMPVAPTHALPVPARAAAAPSRKLPVSLKQMEQLATQ